MRQGPLLNANAEAKEERKRNLATEKKAERMKKASKLKEDRKAARKEQGGLDPEVLNQKKAQEEEDARIFKYVADRKAAAKDKHRLTAGSLEDLMDDS